MSRRCHLAVPHTGPRFLSRNGIIAALGTGVVVVEGSPAVGCAQHRGSRCRTWPAAHGGARASHLLRCRQGVTRCWPRLEWGCGVGDGVGGRAVGCGRDRRDGPARPGFEVTSGRRSSVTSWKTSIRPAERVFEALLLRNYLEVDAISRRRGGVDVLDVAIQYVARDGHHRSRRERAGWAIGWRERVRKPACVGAMTVRVAACTAASRPARSVHGTAG